VSLPALAIALALLAPVAIPALADTQPHETNERVAPGTRGVARTVLEGTSIIEIPVEFVGLYEDAIGPGHDLYLVRLSGEEAEKVGVAAGMSGSPVYVDDEIVGALAYRLGFLPKEPIAGVVPIDDMFGARRAAPPGDGERDGFAPITTPVFLSGVAGPVADALRPELEGMGFFVVSGGGGSEREASARPVGPGSPVGIQLARGDANIAATGTVTWVDDTQVFAFGHSSFGMGRIDLPMVNAEVIHTLADLGGSVKLTRIGAEIGAFREDRLSATVGRVGDRARMLPVSLDVRGGDYEPRTFEFEVARHAVLTPLLTGAMVSNALINNLGFDSEATVRVMGKIRLQDLPDIPVELILASGPRPHPYTAIAARLQQLLATLYGNPFSEPEVEQVELEVDVRRARVEYRLRSVHYDRGPVHPGQTIELTCVLATFRGDTQSRTLEIRVPDEVRPGTRLSLAVGDTTAVARFLGNPHARRLRSADDLESYVRVLADTPPGDRLEAVLFRSAAGAISQGEALTGLPPTAAHLLGSDAGGTGAGYLSTWPLASTSLEMDGPVGGSFRESLEVDDSGGDEQKGE
jgi:hypothetical protein